MWCGYGNDGRLNVYIYYDWHFLSWCTGCILKLSRMRPIGTLFLPLLYHHFSKKIIDKFARSAVQCNPSFSRTFLSFPLTKLGLFFRWLVSIEYPMRQFCIFFFLRMKQGKTSVLQNMFTMSFLRILWSVVHHKLSTMIWN